jgi:hypothetical protein
MRDRGLRVLDASVHLAVQHVEPWLWLAVLMVVVRALEQMLRRREHGTCTR